MYFWKYLFSVPLSTQWHEITTINSFGFGKIKINDNQYFLSGADPNSPYDLHFYKLTYGNTAVDWANKLSCPSGTWTSARSESIINFNSNQSATSLIYHFFIYGNTQYMYFATFNLSNGAVTGNQYISSISWAYVYGSTKTGDFIVVTFYWQSHPYLLLYNTITSQFIVKLFSGGFLFEADIEPIVGR